MTWANNEPTRLDCHAEASGSRQEDCMLEGLHSAAAGMAAQQERISLVSNDLANVSTTGYKHTRVGFRDLLYQEPGRPAVPGAGARVGTGAATVDAGRSMTQGALKQTDSPLD